MNGAAFWIFSNSIQLCKVDTSTNPENHQWREQDLFAVRGWK